MRSGPEPAGGEAVAVREERFLEEELVGRWFEEVLDRRDLEPELRRELARRWSGVLKRLRAFEEERLGATPPAFAFDPAATAAQATPPLPAEAYAAMAAGEAMGYSPAPDAEAPPPDEEPGPATPVPAAAGPVGVDGPPLRARDPLAELSAGELLEAVARGRLSAAELLELTLDRVHRLDPELRAFVHVAGEEARAAAQAADARPARGRPARSTASPSPSRTSSTSKASRRPPAPPCAQATWPPGTRRPSGASARRAPSSWQGEHPRVRLRRHHRQPVPRPDPQPLGARAHARRL